MISIPGKREPGGGWASQNGTIATQLPLIEPEFPEIAQCYRGGTINLKLTLPLLVERPDHRTRPIRWAADWPDEVFEFLRIELEFEAPRGRFKERAWLYIAQHSVHRGTPWIHEILARWLELPSECECIVHINRDYVHRPHPGWPAVVVIL